MSDVTRGAAMSRRILVTGSRTWTDRQKVHDALLAFGGEDGATLVHGACPSGADAIADEIASGWSWVIERHPADWKRHGRAAGPIRNAKMVNLGAYVCLAFIKDGSRGATGTADLADDAGIDTVRFVADTRAAVQGRA